MQSEYQILSIIFFFQDNWFLKCLIVNYFAFKVVLNTPHNKINKDCLTLMHVVSFLFLLIIKLLEFY